MNRQTYINRSSLDNKGYITHQIDVASRSLLDLFSRIYADTLWLTRTRRPEDCDNSELFSAQESFPFDIYIVNEGACASEALIEELYDGIVATLNYLTNKKCRRCCVSLSGSQGWKATLQVVNRDSGDNMNPSIVNCNLHEKHVCKTNVNRCSGCGIHDEL